MALASQLKEMVTTGLEYAASLGEQAQQLGVASVALLGKTGGEAKHLADVAGPVTRGVAALERGESYIKHIGPERIAAAVASGRYAATRDLDRLSECDAILICVPTPLDEFRQPDMSYIVNTAESMTPDRLRAIIYGLPGAGKTTLAAGWYPETNLILDCDGGTRFLPGKHFVEPIDSYSKFMATVNSLVNEAHPFKTVTIDTGDNLFRMADTEAGLRGGKIAAGDEVIAIFQEEQPNIAVVRVRIGGGAPTLPAPAAPPPSRPS